MADDPKPPENQPEGVSEEELKNIVGEAVDSKLNDRGLTKEVMEKLSKLDILDGIEGLFEKHKSGGVDKEGLLSEIGTLIDKKLSGIGSGSGGGNSTERQPKIRILG